MKINKILCFLAISLLSLTSCANVNESNKGNNNSSQIEESTSKPVVVDKTIERYMDDPSFSIGNLDIEYDYYQTKNKNFSIRVNFLSHDSDKINIEIKKAYMLRLSNNVKYDTRVNKNNLTLQCDISDSVRFSGDIPTNTIDEKYHLVFETKKYKYVYKLYNTPLSEQQRFNVEYVINDKVVHTDVAYDKTPYSVDFIWENKRGDKYCDIWRIEQYGSVIDSKIDVNDNIKVYGFEYDSYEFASSQSDRYAWLTEINHIPDSGIIVLPEKVKGKDIAIMNYTIYDNDKITAIYLPSTLRDIAYSNFVEVPNLKTIYFAGTQEQWNQLIADSGNKLPSTIKLVFNTSYKD